MAKQQKSTICQEPPAKAMWREVITRYNTKEHVVLEHFGNPCAYPTSSSKWIPCNGFPMFELCHLAKV